MEFKEMEHDFTPVGIACVCNDCEEVFVIPFDKIEDEFEEYCCDCEEIDDVEDMIDDFVIDEIVELKLLMKEYRDNGTIDEYVELCKALSILVEI